MKFWELFKRKQPVPVREALVALREVPAVALIESLPTVQWQQKSLNGSWEDVEETTTPGIYRKVVFQGEKVEISQEMMIDNASEV